MTVLALVRRGWLGWVVGDATRRTIYAATGLLGSIVTTISPLFWTKLWERSFWNADPCANGSEHWMTWWDLPQGCGHVSTARDISMVMATALAGPGCRLNRRQALQIPRCSVVMAALSSSMSCSVASRWLVYHPTIFSHFLPFPGIVEGCSELMSENESLVERPILPETECLIFDSNSLNRVEKSHSGCELQAPWPGWLIIDGLGHVSIDA